MGAIYPDDDDGAALRAVAANGADMSKPMLIEFTIAAPSIESARSLAERIASIGYSPDLYVDDEDGSVSLYCGRTMIATYEGVVAAQAERNTLCESVGANLAMCRLTLRWSARVEDEVLGPGDRARGAQLNR